MMFRREVKKLRPLPEVDMPVKGTVIGRGMDWHGDLVAAEDVHVFGTLVGNIESTCQVHVQASGRVRGQISAAGVVVSGHVDGDVAAARRIELEGSGRVSGNVAARTVSLAEGAQVGGEVRTLEPQGATARR